jgi:hypothetical protein
MNEIEEMARNACSWIANDAVWLASAVSRGNRQAALSNFESLEAKMAELASLLEKMGE